MKLISLMIALLLSMCFLPNLHAACTPIPETGFSIDGISGLSAALVNPGTVNKQVVNAAGCQLAIYYGPGKSGLVKNSTITGSQLAGIVSNGASVTVSWDNVYQIGDSPFDGDQYGYGIYEVNSPWNGIDHTTIWNYQKNGIFLESSDSAELYYNNVYGQGPVG